MEHREIGSEYEYVDVKQGKGILFPKQTTDDLFVFSGRTAIDTILKNEKSIKKVALPSYCCDSMIEPFRRAGIEIIFYPVYFSNGLQIDINITKDIDCILWCNYFGYNNDMSILQEIKKKDIIIIEDITHSLYSRKQYHFQSDYLVASIRKWSPVLCGGYCATLNREFFIKPEQLPDRDFLFQKKKAMIDKASYLVGNQHISKDVFLSEFRETNAWLANNYSGRTIDEKSLYLIQHIDMEADRISRIENAHILYEGLKNTPDIEFLFPIDDMDCPLVVPVIIKNGKRDCIQKKLIDEEIYCPIHWPHPEGNCESNLYDIELSLVCDQRYCEADMNRIIDVLND